MRCYKCNTEVREHMQFCAACGAPLQITEILIRKAVEKDAAAVEQLYYMTRGQVYFLVRTMVWDEDDAFDLVLESYVKAFKTLSQLKNPDGFVRWMKKTATAQTVEYLKKQQGIFQELTGITEEPEGFADDRVQTEQKIELSWEQTQKELNDILKAMSSWQRILTGAYYGQELSVNEIAENLGISAAMVKGGLMKAEQNRQVEAERLAYLYMHLREYSAACATENLLHQILKKIADKKGKKAAKAVGVAAMAVAGESVGEVAKEGIKATITKIIAGLTATAVIGGGTGAVLSLQDNKVPVLPTESIVQQESIQETQVIQETQAVQDKPEEASGETMQEEQAAVNEPHYISDFSEVDAQMQSELREVLEKAYQEKLDGLLNIGLKDGENDMNFSESMIGSLTDVSIASEGYFAREYYSEGNILFVPCYVTLNDVLFYEADGSRKIVTYEDNVGFLKVTNLFVEESGELVLDAFIDFYGFYTTQELAEKEWIKPLEDSHRVEQISLE